MPDYNDLTYEEKKELAGKCNFLLITVFVTAAFFCGLSSVGWCDFVARDIQLVESVESVDEACLALNLTSLVCSAFLDNHAIGLYAWQATVPVNQRVCLSYDQPIPFVGWVTPDFDSKFNAARAFSIIANVFGGFAFFTLTLASCCPLSQQRLKGLSCYFFIATLFQGLTLIIFRSNVCKIGFFEDYFVNVPSYLDVVKGVSCSLDRGSKLAISATVLYFLCMNMTPAAVAPTPVGMGRGGEEAAAAGGGGGGGGGEGEEE